MWSKRLAPIATASGLAVLGMTAAAPAAPPPGTEVASLDLVDLSEISHDARWTLGRDTVGSLGIVILDRRTSGRLPVEVDGQQFVGFVRDNPALHLTQLDGRTNGVFLTNTTTHSSRRIDTTSKGAPLTPSWTGTCDDECGDTENPRIVISNQSVSKSGRKAAFCANYRNRARPDLYVKDLRTGKLTRTSLTCGVRAYETDHVAPPQISDDGRVVHVNGDWSWWPRGITTHWTADSLYFTATGKSRAIRGWGSMTRDGGTVLMRVGVCPPGTTDTTGGKVGAYNVRTKRTRHLPGNGQIYGTEVLDSHHGYGFSAFDQASRRGRFVVGPTVVVDRTFGLSVDVTAILAASGYAPYTGGDGGYFANAMRRISGDGTTIIAPVGNYFSDDTGSGWTQRQDVALTGWQPPAKVRATANSDGSKLVVDIDPDLGKGHWTFRVQRQGPGPAKTLKKVYRTRGSHETRVINLPAGRYQVKVVAGNGHRGATSSEVLLVK
jgi:hypothetical protein